MAKRKKDTMEFRFYELPQGESALVLCGESWKRVYSRSSLQRELQDLLNKSKIILLKIKKANNVYYLPSSYKRALCLKQTCIK